jgi:hypothetical protein
MVTKSYVESQEPADFPADKLAPQAVLMTDPDVMPAPPDEAITESGDLWILGDHLATD